MSEETEASNSILVLLLLLTFTTIIGHILQSRNSRYLQEASVAMLIGLITGFCVRLIFRKQEEFLDFNVEFFMLVLLPPIIFESGYNINHKYFFKNFGAIILYAFLGTIVSTVVIALFMVSLRLIDVTNLSVKEIFAFSTLISATDPVSVLSIMQQMGADFNLHSFIFGESIFNDAVTIVLYRSVKGIKEINSSNFFGCIGMFFVIFIGSFAIGVILALTMSFLLKHGFTRIEKHRYNVEASIMIMGP